MLKINFTAFDHSVSADLRFWASDLNGERPKLATSGDVFDPFLNTLYPWLCSRGFSILGQLATGLPPE